MPASVSGSAVRIPTLPALLVLLAALAGIGLYVWTAPSRAETRLRNASLSELQTITQREPKNARAFFYLGLRQQEAGEFNLAYDSFARAADLDSTDEDSWIAAAAMATRLHGDQGGFDILATFLKNNPGSARVHLAMALLFKQNLKYRQATEEAVKATELNPRYADAWRVRGEMTLEMAGQEAQAETEMRRALQFSPNDWRNHAGLGSVLRKQNRPAEALAAYEQAVRLAPDQGEAHLALGEAQLALANSPAELEAALRSLSRSVELSPALAGAHLGQGRALARLHRWPEARKALEQAKSLAPDRPEVAFELARVYQQLGQKAAAERERQWHGARRAYLSKKNDIQSRIATRQDNADDRLELARLCRDNGDVREALNHLRRLVAQFPHREDARRELAALQSQFESGVPPSNAPRDRNPVAAALQQADALFGKRRYAEAERAYREVLEQEPDSPPALQGAGLAAAIQNRPEAAYFLLTKATRLDPTLLQAQLVLADLALEAGFPELARNRLERIAERTMTDPVVWNLLGRAYDADDSLRPMAEKALRRAAQLRPRHLPYLLDLAQTLTDLKREQEAEQVYAQVLQLAPDDPAALSRYGAFLVAGLPNAERRQQAEPLLRRALAADPNDAYALYSLGRLALERGDAKQAVSYLNGALEKARQQDVADIWFHLGRAYYRLGDKARGDAATETNRRLRDAYAEIKNTLILARTNTTDPAPRRKLARLYAERNEFARALLFYDRCLELAPTDTLVRKEREALRNRLRQRGMEPPVAMLKAMAQEAGFVY